VSRERSAEELTFEKTTKGDAPKIGKTMKGQKRKS